MEEKKKLSGAQRGQFAREKKGGLAYYLTMFKIEGHSTWRAYLASDPNGFVRQVANNATVVTDKKVYRVDRITGEWLVL